MNRQWNPRSRLVGDTVSLALFGTTMHDREEIHIGLCSMRYYQSSHARAAALGFADQSPSLQNRAGEATEETERRRPGLVRVRSIHSRTLRERPDLPQSSQDSTK